MTTDYSLWLLEYARIPEYPLGAIVYGAYNAGIRVLPLTFYVLQSHDHLVLVDAGYGDNSFTREATALWGIKDWLAPEAVLGHIGFSREDVDTVILTHHHFDHAANLGAFPNATVYIQRREVINFMDKLATPPRMRWLAGGLDPHTMEALTAVAYDGRLRLLDGRATILPGVEARTAFGTHTDGSQYLVINASNGSDLPWVIAGDVVMVEENLIGMNNDGQMTPIGLSQGGQEQDIRIMEEMMQLVDDKIERILPFHETRMWSRSPAATIENGLHIAEVTLAPGTPSRLPKP